MMLGKTVVESVDAKSVHRRRSNNSLQRSTKAKLVSYRLELKSGLPSFSPPSSF